MLTTSLNLNTLAAVSLAASAEQTCFYLCGVMVECRPRAVTYVATNGQIALIAHHTLGKDEAANTLIGDFILPTDICRAFKLHKTPRPSEILATLSAETPASASMTLTRDNDGRHFQLIDGTFPDWRRVVPACGTSFKPLSAETFAQEQHGAAPQFNPECQAIIGKFSVKMGGDQFPHIHYGDAGSPAPVVFSSGAGECFGVIMPVRALADPWRIPSWAHVKPVAVEENAAA